MKRREVVWSRAALSEMIEIAEYIARENLPAARKVARAIRVAGEALGDFATGRRGRVTGTYEKPLAKYPYILVYDLMTTLGGAQQLQILHVIHMSRDWQAEQWPDA